MSVKQLAKQGRCKLQVILAQNSRTFVAFDWTYQFFLMHEKTFFVILIGHIDFFTCEKHRLLFWLARTDLGMEIYINDNLVCLWVSQYQGFW